MEGIYQINLIPSDLSMEETILQIADTLDNLNGIVDDVFSRVLGRIKQNTDKTNKLKEKIDMSRTKVEKLAGMQKAIKVFSCAKYPTSIVHEHYQSVFDLDGYQHKPQKITLCGKPLRPSNEKGIQEKLHFFHVKMAEPKSTKSTKDFDLDVVMDRVSSVGDLLIFNTDESPYLETKSKMPSYVPATHLNVESKSILEEAPPSIMKRNVLKREIDEYMYAPGIGMVPELDMPLDLPHLPGIAGDVQFSVTGNGSIAPSAISTPVMPSTVLPEAELPELPDLKELPDVKLPHVVAPLPDTPDAPPAVPTLNVPTVTSMAAPPPAPPPPPPPPPPPMESHTLTSKKREEKAGGSAAGPPAAAGDAHSNLMAAIRQAGGAGRAKLRPSADAAPPKASIGGDLMADLHAKLSMRRRGISGAERAGAGAGAAGSLLHSLAAVIPEPADSAEPRDSRPHSRSSSDDDWD